MEYLLGQEIIRPVILWLALGPLALPLWGRLKRTVLYYLPFALALAGYLYWRFFMYAHSIYSPVLLHEAGTSPISTLTDLLGTTFGAIYTVLIPSWLQAFQLPTVEALGVSLTWVYGLVFFVVLIGWAWLLQAADDQVERPFPWLWILCGLGGMLVAGAPFFIAGLPLRTTFPENRVSLPFIPFIGLFLTGLFSLIPGRARRYLLAGILLAFAAGFQIQNADLYRDQYKLDKSFFWQLTWRAPGLKPGTALLAQDDQTFIFDDDEALTIPLNLPLLKGCSIVGVFWGDFVRREPKANAAAMMQVPTCASGWHTGLALPGEPLSVTVNLKDFAVKSVFSDFQLKDKPRVTLPFLGRYAPNESEP